jgi:hypothetical protein
MVTNASIPVCAEDVLFQIDIEKRYLSINMTMSEQH